MKDTSPLLDGIKGGSSLLYAFIKNKMFHTPLGVNFDITYRCNLHCEHCYFAASVNAEEAKKRDADLRKNELSDEEWRKIFLHYKKIGTHSISITGGEPTLRMPVIREAAKIFKTIQVASNGIIPIPKEIDSAIWVSLDGGPEIHNKIRGAKIYDKVIANIQDDPRVSISSTLSTTNYKEARVVVENAIKTNVKGVFFMLYSGTTENPLYLTGDKLDYAIESIKELINDYPDFVLLSERMLDSYVTKDFIDKCVFRGENAMIQSFFPNMQRKRCVMGDNVDCQTCSCIVPVGSYCLRNIPPDWETIHKITKILQQ